MRVNAADMKHRHDSLGPPSRSWHMDNIMDIAKARFPIPHPLKELLAKRVP